MLTRARCAFFLTCSLLTLAAAPSRAADIALKPANQDTITLPAAGNNSTAFKTAAGKEGWIVSISNEPLPTPAYANGMILTGGGYGSRNFVALKADTGANVWKVATTDNGPTSPVVDGDFVAFNTESCHTEVISLNSGKTIWSALTGSTLLTQPLIANNTLVVPHPNTGVGDIKFRILKVSLKNFDAGLDTPMPGDVLSAPVFHNNALFYACIGGQLAASTFYEGSAWRVDAKATSAPVVTGSYVVTTTDEGSDTVGIRRFDITSGRLIDEKPLAPTLVRHKLSPSAVTPNWDYQGPKLAFANGTLFNAPGNTINAVTLADGTLLWRATVGDSALLPPALGKENIYIASADGHLYVLKQKDASLVYACNLGCQLSSPPILADGNIYLATRTGALLCLKLADADATGWAAWGGNAHHNKVD